MKKHLLFALLLLALAPVSRADYSLPSGTQYWGFVRSPQLQCHDKAVAIYPAYYPVVWENDYARPGVEYSWSYINPAGEKIEYSDDAEALTVIYTPDFSSDESARCTLYSSPVLRADYGLEDITDYQASFAELQAGGCPPELLDADGKPQAVTMLPYNHHQLGTDYFSVEEKGVPIPVYGYNGPETDLYWINYSLNSEGSGATLTDGDYSHLIAIANLLRPSNEAPIVLHGATVYGYGQISDQAEFKLSIRSIIRGQENNIDYNVMGTVASATVNGSDIMRQGDGMGYLCLPFEFDEPVVLSVSDKPGEIMAYFVMFEGFRSEHVSYFAPLQNKEEDPDGVRVGYMIHHIDLTNHVQSVPYYSTKTMRYIEDGEYTTFSGAFAIGLDAEYPWIKAAVSQIDLPIDGTPANVRIYSYYDGSGLTVEAPAGVHAEVSGRYGNCILSASLDGTVAKVSGDIVVKGLGVETSVAVTGISGSTDIIVDDPNVAKTIYDLSGRRIDASPLAPGIYIIRQGDKVMKLKL